MGAEERPADTGWSDKARNVNLGVCPYRRNAMAKNAGNSLPLSSSRKKTRAPSRRRGSSNRTLVRRLKDAIVNKVETNEIKATVSDFVRLIELEERMDESSPRGIEVRWVDPSETESAGER